ncbi:hypothetical protein Tco_0978178, partial [Tanacetum coccineum]
VGYYEDIDYFKDFETDFPAIVYKDALTHEHEISSEPTVSPHRDDGINFDFKISFDESDDKDYIVNSDNDKVEINISSDDIIVEPSDGVIDVKIDTHFHEFDENREASHDIPDMAQLPPRDQRHPWLRYKGQEYTDVVIHDYEARLGTIFGRQVNRVHVLDFEGLTDEMRQTLTDRLRMVHTGTKGQVLFTSDAWKRVFGIRGLLVQELILCLFHRFYMRFVSPVGVLVIGESVGSVPERFILRRLGSIFTSVYVAVQKMKKDSWKELQFNLVDNSKLNVFYFLNRS